MIVSALNAWGENEIANKIVYIPEGSNIITPSVDGKPKRIQIDITPENGAEIASALQADLVRRQAENVRPFMDFDHNASGPASGLPKEFSYSPGEGIMVEVEWSGAGKRAIEGKDYSYFSPEFLIDDNMRPIGLTRGGPIGSLVNDPAFRNIKRIAAASAAEHLTDNNNDMETLIKCGLLNADEAAKKDAQLVAAARVTSLREDASKVEAMSAKLKELEEVKADLEKKVEASNAEALKARTESAESLVQAAVADGRLAPKDEDTQGFYRDLIVEKGEVAVKALNALGKIHDGLQTQQVKAADAKQTDEGKCEFESKAAELVKAGSAKDKEEAFSIVAASHPELYSNYCTSL